MDPRLLTLQYYYGELSLPGVGIDVEVDKYNPVSRMLKPVYEGLCRPHHFPRFLSSMTSEEGKRAVSRIKSHSSSWLPYLREGQLYLSLFPQTKKCEFIPLSDLITQPDSFPNKYIFVGEIILDKNLYTTQQQERVEKRALYIESVMGRGLITRNKNIPASEIYDLDHVQDAAEFYIYKVRREEEKCREKRNIYETKLFSELYELSKGIVSLKKKNNATRFASEYMTLYETNAPLYTKHTELLDEINGANFDKKAYSSLNTAFVSVENYTDAYVDIGNALELSKIGNFNAILSYKIISYKMTGPLDDTMKYEIRQTYRTSASIWMSINVCYRSAIASFKPYSSDYNTVMESYNHAVGAYKYAVNAYRYSATVYEKLSKITKKKHDDLKVMISSNLKWNAFLQATNALKAGKPNAKADVDAATLALKTGDTTIFTLSALDVCISSIISYIISEAVCACAKAVSNSANAAYNFANAANTIAYYDLVDDSANEAYDISYTVGPPVYENASDISGLYIKTAISCKNKARMCANTPTTLARVKELDDILREIEKHWKLIHKKVPNTTYSPIDIYVFSSANINEFDVDKDEDEDKTVWSVIMPDAYTRLALTKLDDKRQSIETLINTTETENNALVADNNVKESKRASLQTAIAQERKKRKPVLNLESQVRDLSEEIRKHESTIQKNRMSIQAKRQEMDVVMNNMNKERTILTRKIDMFDLEAKLVQHAFAKKIPVFGNIFLYLRGKGPGKNESYSHGISYMMRRVKLPVTQVGYGIEVVLFEPYDTVLWESNNKVWDEPILDFFYDRLNMNLYENDLLTSDDVYTIRTSRKYKVTSVIRQLNIDYHIFDKENKLSPSDPDPVFRQYNMQFIPGLPGKYIPRHPNGSRIGDEQCATWALIFLYYFKEFSLDTLRGENNLRLFVGLFGELLNISQNMYNQAGKIALPNPRQTLMESIPFYQIDHVPTDNIRYKAKFLKENGGVYYTREYGVLGDEYRIIEAEAAGHVLPIEPAPAAAGEAIPLLAPIARRPEPPGSRKRIRGGNTRKNRIVYTHNVQREKSRHGVPGL